MTIDYDRLWDDLSKRFRLGNWSIHGPDHWRKVERNGIQLAQLNGADLDVVRLFALFHDVERESDGSDPDHGRRAAKLAGDLNGVNFHLADNQLELLLEALSYHNDGQTSVDVTIGTCWDADRMDLPRVGIQPRAALMSTELGKRFATHGDSAIALPNDEPPG